MGGAGAGVGDGGILFYSCLKNKQLQMAAIIPVKRL